MKEIRNKTAKPVRVPLKLGKTLFLGPSQTAQVADNATESAGFQKLIADGQIELVGDGGKVARHIVVRRGLVAHGARREHYVPRPHHVWPQ